MNRLFEGGWILTVVVRNSTNYSFFAAQVPEKVLGFRAGQPHLAQTFL